MRRRDRHEVPGRSIVVAGGTGGIGGEVARGVVREGENVLLVARDEGRLAQCVASLDARAGRTGAAAMDLARYGIRVNVVSPGLVRTPMSAAITSSEAGLKASQAMHPTGRISEPADVAAAVLSLLSDGAANVTGAVLPVDGGMAAGRPPAMAS